MISMAALSGFAILMPHRRVTRSAQRSFHRRSGISLVVRSAGRLSRINYSTLAITRGLVKPSGSGPFHANTFDGRGDYQAPGNLHIFGRYTRAFYSITGQPGLGIGLGGLGGGIGGLSGSSNIHNHSLAAGFDKAISSTLLTDFRFGWFQYNPHSIKPDANVAAAEALGRHGLNLPSDSSTGGLPAFVWDSGDNKNTQLTDFGDGLDPSRCNCPLIEKEHQYQFVNK